MSWFLEKYPDGTIVLFGRFSWGIIPLIIFLNDEEAHQFIKLFERSLVLDIPAVFKNAFDD